MGKPLSFEEITTLLRAGPQLIEQASDRAPNTLMISRPTPEEWSPVEVLAHLRACADVWGDCISRILAADGVTIRAVNPRTWVRSTNYLEIPFRLSFEEFASQRRGLVGVLEGLTPKQWGRQAKVTGAGRPLIRSVYDYARWMATHERPHIKQIIRAVEPKSLTQSAGGSARQSKLRRRGN